MTIAWMQDQLKQMLRTVQPEHFCQDVICKDCPLLTKGLQHCDRNRLTKVINEALGRDFSKLCEKCGQEIKEN